MDVSVMDVVKCLAVLLVGGALYWFMYDKIASMPRRLWSLARDEFNKNRADEDLAAAKLLQEVANKKVGALLAGIRQYQLEIEAQYAKVVSDGDLRRRVSERQVAETAVNLETAAGMIRDLRSALTLVQELPGQIAALQGLLSELRSFRVDRATGKKIPLIPAREAFRSTTATPANATIQAATHNAAASEESIDRPTTEMPQPSLAVPAANGASVQGDFACDGSQHCGAHGCLTCGMPPVTPAAGSASAAPVDEDWDSPEEELTKVTDNTGARAKMLAMLKPT